MRATHGGIELAVPAGSKFTLDASVANGEVSANVAGFTTTQSGPLARDGDDGRRGLGGEPLRGGRQRRAPLRGRRHHRQQSLNVGSRERTTRRASARRDLFLRPPRTFL